MLAVYSVYVNQKIHFQDWLNTKQQRVGRSMVDRLPSCSSDMLRNSNTDFGIPSSVTWYRKHITRINHNLLAAITAIFFSRCEFLTHVAILKFDFTMPITCWSYQVV